MARADIIFPVSTIRSTEIDNLEQTRLVIHFYLAIYKHDRERENNKGARK